MSNTKGADLKDDDQQNKQPEAKEFEDTVLDFMTDLRDNFCHMDRRVCGMEDSMQQRLDKMEEAMDGRMTALEEKQAQSVADLQKHVEKPLPRGQRLPMLALTPRVQSTSTPQVGNSSQELQSSHLSTESEGAQGLQDSVDISMDYSTAGWDKDPEDEALQSTKLFKVEEKTEKFLGTHFSTAISNTARRQLKEKYGAPNISATACPNVDKVIKGRLNAVTKSRDKQMAKQQALMLDAVGPLTHILEEAAKGELTQRSAVDAAQTALKLLGNASAHASRERRKIAIQSMNPRLVDMAEDDALYSKAAPSLFGEGFCKKAKERDEELKCLNQATSSKGGGGNFFRGGRSSHTSNQTRGGSGQNYRGRGRGSYQGSQPYRYQPYQTYRRQKFKQDDKKN